MTPQRNPVPSSPLGDEMQDDTELEAAPAGAHDVRVPLEERPPAQKRERSEEPPDRSNKWQAYETHGKRERDESEPKEPAKWQAVEANVEAVEEEEEGDAVEAAFEEFLRKVGGPRPNGCDINAIDNEAATRNHPGPRVHRQDVGRGDKTWQDIGSGAFARTFFDVSKLFVTTRGGPPMCDVHRRTARSLRTGKVIDDLLHRRHPGPYPLPRAAGG